MMSEAESQAIWREGLRRLAEEIKEYGPGLTMITEMLDRLLFETGWCQNPEEIAKILEAEGIDQEDVEFVAQVYSIVDMVRTGGHPIEVYIWAENEMERIQEKARASL